MDACAASGIPEKRATAHDKNAFYGPVDKDGGTQKTIIGIVQRILSVSPPESSGGGAIRLSAAYISLRSEEKKYSKMKPAFETAAVIVPPKYDVLPVLCSGPGILQPVIILSRIYLFYRARYMKCEENAGVSSACAELFVRDIFDRTYRAELRYWTGLQDIADCWPKKIRSSMLALGHLAQINVSCDIKETIKNNTLTKLKPLREVYVVCCIYSEVTSAD